MVSKNRCPKVNVSLNEEDGAACMAVKAAKYKPDIIYLLFLEF